MLVVALALALGAVGCGDDDEPITTATEEVGAGTTAPEAEERVPAEPSGGDTEQTGNGQLPATTTSDPEDALQDALASGDPRLACEDAVTDAYVREAYGSAQGCRAAQGDEALADDVRLEKLTVRGAQGRGTVRFDGGTYDGEKGKIELVIEGEAWKLDSLEVDVPPGP